MTEWVVTQGPPYQPLEEIYGRTSTEPVDVYASRYSAPLNNLKYKDDRRYVQEVLGRLRGSLLVFGAGHSQHCNNFMEWCPNLTNIASLDFVEEAGLGLDPSIVFHHCDILTGSIGTSYDYVFSSHTIEHFTRAQIFNIVIPKLCSIANKAVITVVPYGENWKEELSHKCFFYEDDEFAALSSKYKIIWDNREIVYWVNV